MKTVSERYEVVKIVEVVIDNQQFRIEALRRGDDFSTSVYLRESVMLTREFMSENGARNPRASEIWVPYGAPWTHRNTADEAIDQCIAFLEAGETAELQP